MLVVRQLCHVGEIEPSPSRLVTLATVFVIDLIALAVGVGVDDLGPHASLVEYRRHILKIG